MSQEDEELPEQEEEYPEPESEFDEELEWELSWFNGINTKDLGNYRN